MKRTPRRVRKTRAIGIASDKASSVAIVSFGAPDEEWNRTWTRVSDFPLCYVSSSPGWSVQWAPGVGWAVMRDLTAGQGRPQVDLTVCCCYAHSSALHPCTTFPGEWRRAGDGEVLLGFGFAPAHCGTEDAPVSMMDLGEDYFLRTHNSASGAVWFRLPTGEVHHSLTKRSGVHKKPGVRYCHLCGLNISANNLVSQHIPNVHLRDAATTTTVESVDDVRLALWMAR